MELILTMGILLAFVIGVACMGEDALDSIYYKRSTSPKSYFDLPTTCRHCESSFYVDEARLAQSYCSKFCEIYTQDLTGRILYIIFSILLIGICILIGSVILIGGLWIISILSSLNLSNVEILLWGIIFLLLFKK
jgi:hypothetical protein